MRTRILFASDVHGSERCWKKFLNAAKIYDVDVLILGGDLTGKAVVSIVEQEDSTYLTSAFGQELRLKDRKQVEDLKDNVRDSGYYPYVCTSTQVQELQSNKENVDKLFDQMIIESVQRWIEMIESRVAPDVNIILNPGNDDRFCVDDVIRRSGRIIYPLKKVVWIDDHHPMISCEWTNPTPWNSPRECSEERLENLLEEEFARMQDRENLICNFHAPPFGTLIDNAPELKNLRPVMSSGGLVMTHVGSKAVRGVLERNQPLLGLHGHIHESHGEMELGRTKCFNPGSEYQEGLLRFYVIDLSEKGIENYLYLSGL